ncbi:MAG: phenylalanine-4-hydroxylase [Flavobacterium sp.]|jgi:phenylalanine-4-hydroxylase
MSQDSIQQQLPVHLRQYVAEQDYEARYSSRDQAVWRYVLAQLVSHLTDKAHPVYFDGLVRTGITLDSIPSIDEMNNSLSHLGWRAIVVDGFIPPQAFMELQSLKVLAIALDMRAIEHIEYTPAPDIIHEAAGHAPIIADEEYSEYLQKFGEVGMKAIFNNWDLAVYEAVRGLSIAKENTDLDSHQLRNFEDKLQCLLDNQGQPSELAMLTRLHWWTVEYGLVGSLDDNKIFGAGLLSSLRESDYCLGESIIKRPLSVEAVLTSYDITKPQPQLFVTKSCRHLTQVLEEYAHLMCYQVGGSDSIQTAIDAGIVATCEYSSGLQVSGKFNRLLQNALGSEIYLGTEGPTQLAINQSEIEGHDIRYHRKGFGSPIGRVCNLMKALEDASEYDLQMMGIKREGSVTLEFLSGVQVQGKLDSILKENGKLVLFSFSNCTVSGPSGETLFDPSWGNYDMAVGESIVSVFAGSADRSKCDVYPPKLEKIAKVDKHSKETLEEFDLYARVRECRDSLEDGKLGANALNELIKNAQEKCPSAWLLHLELYELSISLETHIDLTAHYLDLLCVSHPIYAPLITQGRNLHSAYISD